MNDDIPSSHPRYVSLLLRERIVAGVAGGITSEHGLLAHGRGEAFDYMLEERTHLFAERAIGAAAAKLLLAEHAVISVNGNAAALVPAELVKLADVVGCPLEVNLFHSSTGRELRIERHLRDHGAKEVLMPSDRCLLPGIDSNRRKCNPNGIFKADVVFVPLEDGDRCGALRKIGKDVITIDLNPASRTSRAATITIVDNIVRALPLLIRAVEERAKLPQGMLKRELSEFSHEEALRSAHRRISEGFQEVYDFVS